MIYVEQTILAPPLGNCLAACIATLLRLPIEDLPNPHGEDWADAWNEWLRPRDIKLVWFEEEAINHWRDAGQWSFDWIATFPSPRGDWGHCVCMCADEMTWDPHPLRGFVYDLATLWDGCVIVPLDWGSE